MKHFDKKIKQAGIISLLVICGGILFYYCLFNSESFFSIGSKVFTILMPFIYGFFIAYILNPVMIFIEEKIILPLRIKLSKKSIKNKSVIRLISVILTVAFFLSIVYALIIMVFPQVFESIQSIALKCPDYFNRFNSWLNKFIENNKDLAKIIAPYMADVETWFIDNVLPNLQEWVTNASTNIIGGVYTTISQLIKFVLGIIIAIFLLLNKELYCAQSKKIIYAVLREERANNLINNVRFANKTFGGFLNGKIVDSLIIGILTFIVLSIFKIPYTMLISVVVGVTNIIPYFGPILGAIPSVIILLMVNPRKALWFLIIVVIIQQLDGNFIGPKILGESTGLSSFWVIFAITVFGGFFGVFGMFIGVPLFAVIYAAIRTFVNERLRKKLLPDSTKFYIDSDYHSDDYITNSGKEIIFVKKTFENIYVEGKGKRVIVTIDKDENQMDSDSDSSSDS